jgi:hypothetical protein
MLRKHKILSSLLLLIIILSGCSKADPKTLPDEKHIVFQDQGITIEAGKAVIIEGGFLVELTVTNNSECPILLNGSVGARAYTADGRLLQEENLLTVIEAAKSHLSDYAPIDGILQKGNQIHGYICIAAPEDLSQPVKIEIATDYLSDIWISFEYLFV